MATYLFLLHLRGKHHGYRTIPSRRRKPDGQHRLHLFPRCHHFHHHQCNRYQAYWKEIFWPEVPTWLKVPVPLMPFIELFGIFTKPLALIIRLFANMMAGHAIALSFAAIIFIMFNISENAIVNYVAGTGMTVVSVAMSAFMMLLEVLVSYIQALVFTMLSAVFISQAHVHEAEPEIAK